jgi:hypothetical protein
MATVWANEGVAPNKRRVRGDWMARKAGCCFYDMVDGDLWLTPDMKFDYRMLLRKEKYMNWPIEDQSGRTSVAQALYYAGFKKNAWMDFVMMMAEGTNSRKFEDLDEEHCIAKRLLNRMRQDYDAYFKFDAPLK